MVHFDCRLWTRALFGCSLNGAKETRIKTDCEPLQKKGTARLSEIDVLRRISNEPANLNFFLLLGGTKTVCELSTHSVLVFPLPQSASFSCWTKKFNIRNDDDEGKEIGWESKRFVSADAPKITVTRLSGWNLRFYEYLLGYSFGCFR